MQMSPVHIEQNKPSELTPPISTPNMPGAEGGFGERFLQAVAQLAAPVQEGQKAVDAFARGQEGELHETLLQVDKADISLKYLVTLRNRCLEAYREVMRMGS